MATKTDDLLLKDIGHFHGTEKYHAGYLGVNLTDGVAYIVDNGYSWFVTDFIATARTIPKLLKEPFLTADLTVDNGKATMRVTDGNNTTLYTQNYTYTDAKTSVKLFYADNVLMLSGEY